MSFSAPSRRRGRSPYMIPLAHCRVRRRLHLLRRQGGAELQRAERDSAGAPRCQRRKGCALRPVFMQNVAVLPNQSTHPCGRSMIHHERQFHVQTLRNHTSPMVMPQPAAHQRRTSAPALSRPTTPARQQRSLSRCSVPLAASCPPLYGR